MMDTERGGCQEQPPHQLNPTQMFAGPNDGLSQTYNGISTFVGLQGHSRKAGYRVIFPTLDMGRYLEIAEADILETEELPPGDSPFGALGGTRVSVRETAPIMTSRAASPAREVDDEFDLDIRLGASGWSVPPGMYAPDQAIYAPGLEGEERLAKPIQTNGACPTETRTVEATCHTCVTCETCATCATQCEQATCQATCKGEATCHTCATLCDQATCGVTCVTCPERGCPLHTQTCCKETCF